MASSVKRDWAAFQRRKGLVADGDPGRKTLAAVLELEALESGFTVEVALRNPYTFGGESVRSGVDRDPLRLIPSFAGKVQALFNVMRVYGYLPYLWEGYRTPKRAALLDKKGTGIKLSMHCLGAAVDIVDETMRWDAEPVFWRALRREAQRLKLVVLYKKGQPHDMPHVQALPVSAQSRFRRMSKVQQRAYIDRRLTS